MFDEDTWFLLVQHRSKGKTDVESFSDYFAAARAYNEAEHRYKSQLSSTDADVDVLLVGAASLDLVKERYPSYFGEATSKADRVTGLLNTMQPVPAQ
ncbi:hypothetical protein SAMN06265360_114157 [Haloechinothrix alba]|uniref:Uncharacterized protein n=1 Tax=Haloechinothrix alba TaxID=664784 RepID=A0A238YEF9_9PSEU|nr:hypothetical protein SAMN06265360_114157 [Haloechinothrix alba]